MNASTGIIKLREKEMFFLTSFEFKIDRLFPRKIIDRKKKERKEKKRTVNAI